MYDEFYNVVLPQPEIWKGIEGFEDYYQVSNYGRLKSLDRITTFVRNGVITSRKFKGKILSPKYDKDGYESYGLTAEGETKHVRGHRMVAQAFVPTEDKSLVVDHKDANVIHNSSWNLQWMTSRDNTIKYYGVDSGLEKPLSSLTKYDWLYIGFLYKEGILYSAICENIGLGIKSESTIWEGLSGRRLSSVTGFKKGDFEKRVHPTTKLSIDQVSEIIKERLLDKTPLKVLSKKYNIAESMISRFCSGKRQPEGLELFKLKYKGEYQ